MNEMRRKTPPTKHQIPSSKHHINFKLQNPFNEVSSGELRPALKTLVRRSLPLEFGVMNLVLGASLVFGVWCLVFFGTSDASAQDTHPKAKPAEKLLYENDFEKAEIGKVPDEFVVLDGAFVV